MSIILAALADTVTETASKVPESELDAMYGVGYHLFSEGHHLDAGRIFALLAYYRPKEPRYLEATALACMKLNDHCQAIHLFARALEVVPERLDLALLLADCMLRNGNRETALVVLAGIAGHARELGDAQAEERATGMLELLTPPVPA
ncbi:MAG: tetratricopeptide repeat protein [Pseudomonadota bacterium]